MIPAAPLEDLHQRFVKVLRLGAADLDLTGLGGGDELRAGLPGRILPRPKQELVEGERRNRRQLVAPPAHARDHRQKPLVGGAEDNAVRVSRSHLAVDETFRAGAAALQRDYDRLRDRLFFWMMPWIVRAKMSVPPPAPAVTTNSTGFVGVKATAGAAIAKEAAAAAISGVKRISVLPLPLRGVLSASRAPRSEPRLPHGEVPLHSKPRQVCCIQDAAEAWGGAAVVVNGGADHQNANDAAMPRRIVDAHHHVWDTRLGRHPWLCEDPLLRFRYGDYAAIRRPYLLSDYRRDAGEIEIAASVYVETEWRHDDPVGEMDWVAALKACDTLPSVAVAQAWLDRADCAAVLESHAARGFVRSVRHKPRANPAPGGPAGAMVDPDWRAGFALLAPLGFHFDLQTPWWHLGEARALADAFPSTRIVLNHTGLPADRSQDAIAGWRSAMSMLAGAPNVCVKISGIGQPGKPWTAEANRESC